MVGVPGRSKGCNTCRKRRVKCDEAKPLCNRCSRGGFECQGYGRDILWRHTSTAPFPEEQERQKSPHTQQHTFAVQTPPPPAVSQRARRPPQKQQRQQGNGPLPELSLVAFEDNFYVSFMFENFVWTAYGGPWMDQAAQGRMGELSHDAAKALARANFGHRKRQSQLEKTGHSEYGRCLVALAGKLGPGMERAAVPGGGKAAVGELLVPILLLLMHASLQAHREGAVYHMKATARLLYTCGPEAVQTQPLLNAFDAARATLVVGSLISKRRLFLEEERWCTVPWALNPSAKSNQSKLLDILIAIPGMLEDHAALGDSEASGPLMPVDPYLLYGTLVDRVATKLTALYAWRWSWQLESGHEASAVDADDDMSPLGARIRFARFGASSDIMLYNAVLMWLLALLWKMAPLHAAGIIANAAAHAATRAAYPRRPTRPAYTESAPLQQPGDALSVRDPAIEICRVFEWQSTNHACNREPAFLYLFPVGLAMSVLADDEADLRDWLLGLLSASPVTKGYGGYASGQRPGASTGTVTGFGFYLTREALNPQPEVVIGQEEKMWLFGEGGI